MKGNETRWHIGSIALFLLPIVLVKVSGVMMSPAKSSAASDLTPATSAVLAPALPSAGEVSDVVRAAQEHVTALEAATFGPMPLSTGAGPGEEIIEPTGVAPQFNVQAILASASGNTALIDGKPYRAGQLLGATGWSVVEINSGERAVTIREDATGRTERRVVRLPGE